MSNTLLKRVMIAVYFLAMMTLMVPIMGGRFIGERFGEVFVIRGFNLVEFAPAAWFALFSPLILLLSRVIFYSDYYRVQVWRTVLAFSLSGYIISLPYAWNWLKREMDIATIYHLRVILYPTLISIVLLLESKRAMPGKSHIERDSVDE